MEIRLIKNGDAEYLSSYYLKNQTHFREWEPKREYGFHSLPGWEKRLVEMLREQEQKSAAYVVVLEDEAIIGHCTLSHISYGPFQACYMGYAISKEHEGQGKMKHTCEYAISYAFETLGLNRIMANYMPHNNKSAKLLKKLGFKIEGKAEKYLKINGKWQDHILTALINPKTYNR